MQINKIQLNKPQAILIYPKYNNSTFKLSSKSSEISIDRFERNTAVKKSPVFTGNSIYEKCIIRFLKNKCYQRSIKASRRLYTKLDSSLENITELVQIPVSNKESINAFDINPNNAKKYIIFLHGFSQNITSNQPLYKALSKSNYGILAIDYRSYGRNKMSKHIKESDIAQDTISALKYLEKKGIEEVGIIGHSFGGYLAAKVSNTHNISFQVLVAPLLSLEFWLKKVLKHPQKYKHEMNMIKYIPKFKDQYSKIFNITEHIATNRTPTYVVQSKFDRYVRAEKVTKLTKLIPNLKTYTLIPSGGHRMNDEKIKEISRIIQNL